MSALQFIMLIIQVFIINTKIIFIALRCGVAHGITTIRNKATVKEYKRRGHFLYLIKNYYRKVVICVTLLLLLWSLTSLYIF